MNEFDFVVFTDLFKSVYLNCFGHVIDGPLTETESKLFCNRVLDQTGLSIGWKSVKNYSFFVMDAAAGKPENPSVATLDTLARYVLVAPYTNEIQRKNDESHHPYWFLYRENYRLPKQAPATRNRKLLGAGVFVIGLMIIIGLGFYFKHVVSPKSGQFTDDFAKIDETSLYNDGWFLKSKDPAWWNKRSQQPGQLTLYTLKGDNWPDPASKPNIKNLLLHRITSDCFTAEVHLHNFIPKERWQQAGILLLEDTTFAGKSIRLSLAYNDFFGGVRMPHEILIQAITSLGNGFGKPEEIAHKPIFYPDSNGTNPILIRNMEYTALRIEKKSNKFRFLYSGGSIENGAFKEVVTQDFNMKPKYIGIFAIKGFTNSADTPVSFEFFRITDDPCE